MKKNNLFFYIGEGKMENQQIVLSKNAMVAIVDGDNELLVDSVKKIDIKTDEQGKIKISLNPQITFLSTNKKIVINEIADKIYIEMLNSEEQLSKYTSLVNAQKAKGLIDYILEYAPNLYTKEYLIEQSLDELCNVKENMDDLANCY